MPKVFYGSRARSVTPPSGHGSDDSGSEASTDIEVPRRRPAHRRGESVEVSQPDPKRVRTRTARDAQGRRPLQKACQRNDVNRVRSLLSQQVDLEDRDYAGTTALHDAALNGNSEIVSLLLQYGAVVDVRSGLEELDTPLMDAVAAGSVDVTKLLIDAGADPRISNAVGKTAIDFLDEEDESAAEISKLLEGATRALRSAGAPVIDGPSHANAPQNLFPPGYEARKRVSSTNFIDVTRRTGRVIHADAVAHAAEGNLAFVGLALERGWSPSPEALVKAAKFGHQEVVGLLLAFGLDADATYEGQTALKAAVLRGHVSTAQLLIQSGASLDHKDTRGRTYQDLVADLPPSDPIRSLIEGVKQPVDSNGGSDPATMGSEELSEKSSKTGDQLVNASSKAEIKVDSGASKDTVEEPRNYEKIDSVASGSKNQPRSASQIPRVAPEKPKHPHGGSRSLSSGSIPESKESRSAVDPRSALKSDHVGGNGSLDRNVRSFSDGSRGLSKDSGSDRTHASSPRRISDPRSVQRAHSRSESRSEPRPEAFRLTDLRAIKPKKRSKLVADTDQAVKSDEVLGSSLQPAGSAKESVPPLPAVDTSAATPHESPALSPLTEAPPDKSRTPDLDSPKWVERSNELAELAKRKEKQRLAREARMLQSLAHEEHRRSQESPSPLARSPMVQSPASQSPASHSPAPQSPVAESPVDPHAVESVHPSPAVLPGASEPVMAKASAEAIGGTASVKHLPYFLRQLAYTGEAQDVGPLFVHYIGAVPYYLDVQLAALVGNPRLHVQYPELPKVLVTDVHKPLLWCFCRPWAVDRPSSAGVLASEEAAFTSLPLTWVPKSVVDERVFQNSPPSSVTIQLGPPKPVSKWSTLLSDSSLPLRLQFRATLPRQASEW